MQLMYQVPERTKIIAPLISKRLQILEPVLFKALFRLLKLKPVGRQELVLILLERTAFARAGVVDDGLPEEMRKDPHLAQVTRGGQDILLDRPDGMGQGTGDTEKADGDTNDRPIEFMRLQLLHAQISVR